MCVCVRACVCACVDVCVCVCVCVCVLGGGGRPERLHGPLTLPVSQRVPSSGAWP